MGRGRCGRRRTKMGRGRCGRRRTVLGWRRYGRRRILLARGRCGRRSARSARAGKWSSQGSLRERTACLDYRNVQQRAVGQVAHPLRGTFDVFRQVACSFCWWWFCEVKKTSKILIGDSSASIHCTDHCALFYNRRPPTPDDKFLVMGNGKKMEVEFFGCVIK